MKTLFRHAALVMTALTVYAVKLDAKTLKLSAQIVNRQASTSQYAYAVPGYAQSNCNVSVYGNSASSNCSGSGMPAMAATFHVQGATLSLLLPDSRIVVVNCDAKANWTNWHQGVYRDCRVPPSDHVEAEFNGDKAKLVWTVSLDGSKQESETYKIVGILSRIH